MKITAVTFMMIFGISANAEKVVAADKVIAKATPVQTSAATKSSMETFVEQIVALRKYVSVESEFKDPKNTEVIQSHLKKLAAAVKATKHDPSLIQDNYKFSRHVLEEHVVETERVFRLGNKNYARWMMNSTLNVCMSCHLQGTDNNRRFTELVTPKYFVSEFDRAEFLFAVQDYAAANKLYEKLIMNYPDSLNPQTLETSVQRQVAYYTRIGRDLDAGNKILKKFLTNKKLPEFVRLNTATWAANMEKWKKIKIPDPKTAKGAEVIAFAKANLSPNGAQNGLEASDPRLVVDLIVSGVLFNYLGANPRTEYTPNVLYWLSVADREIDNTFFSSLADLYLRECMTVYPENPIAATCYKQYASNVVLGYTGTSGTHLPADVAADLKQLKDLVDNKGKVQIRKQAP